MPLGDGIRRNVAQVDPSERELLRDAFLELNRRRFPGSPTDQPPGGVSMWFKQDEIHQATHVHSTAEFVPWHREIVNRMEAMLREVDPRLSLHYWDWTQDPRSIPNANLGGGATGTLNLFTREFMGYGGSSEAVIGPPWQNASAPWKPDGFYVPGASPDRDGSENPAYPPDNVTRSINGSPASAAEDAKIVDAPDYPTMWREMKAVHDRMHGFVFMGGQHISFRDPFVFLLHSNVDRLYAMWQMRHGQRRDPATVYGTDGAFLDVDIEPWAGTPPSVRPWAPPENAREPKTYKHPSVVTPPAYDTMPKFPTGALLRYEDLAAPGIAGHSDPDMIGGGGWQAFTFLVAGDNGVIYAVNSAGELLRYEDLTAQGIAGHSDPVVIGGSSWDDFKFLVGGDNGVIYAVPA